MAAEKPDITGQRFGRLTVLGKGEIVRRGGKSRRLWDMQCDCGRVISIPRSNVEKPIGPQVSCGCAKRDNSGRTPTDITGQRFGSLTAVRLTDQKQYGRPAWLLQCDCGATTHMTLKRLNMGFRLNCGSMIHDPGLHYPPMPVPMPAEVGAIVQKYLKWIEPRQWGETDDPDIEDKRMDRLIRAAWIVVYRQQSGEEFSDLKELRYVLKSLRYSRADVRRKRFVDAGGVCSYTYQRYKRDKKIGSKMTDVTSFSEAVNPEGETQPVIDLPATRKKMKFKQC